MQPFTAASIPIDLLRRDSLHGEVVGATGTGFLYHADQTYLVTAWHNVTGYDFKRQRLLHTEGFVPEILRYGLWKMHDQHMARREWREIGLLESKETWFQHPKFSHGIDVCTVPIDYVEDKNWLSKPVNKLNIETRLRPMPGLEAFVIGFPENLSGPSRTAIWKRASVASEALIAHDGLDFFYVDTATRRGMSGSPVIIRHHGIFDPDATSGEMTLNGVIGTVENFCGIYVGRVGDDELGVQLGVVWKENVIREVIEGRSPGRNPAIEPR